MVKEIYVESKDILEGLKRHSFGLQNRTRYRQSVLTDRGFGSGWLSLKDDGRFKIRQQAGR